MLTVHEPCVVSLSRFIFSCNPLFTGGIVSSKLGYGAFICYIGTILAANAAIIYFGFVPVGFGFVAPAGVYFAGLSFILRDVIQDTLTRYWTIGAIVIGAIVSALLSPQLALASGLAFLVSEFADYAIYTPLRKKTWVGAAIASNTVGSIIDSVLFLWLAFKSLEYVRGHILGKLWMTAITIALVVVSRNIFRTKTTVSHLS